MKKLIMGNRHIRIVEEKTHNPKSKKLFVLRFQDNRPDKIYPTVNDMSKAWSKYQSKGIRCSMRITKKVRT